MFTSACRTPGRLGGLDLDDYIEGEVLRCPAQGRERVDGRGHSFLLQARHYQGLERVGPRSGPPCSRFCLSLYFFGAILPMSHLRASIWSRAMQDHIVFGSSRRVLPICVLRPIIADHRRSKNVVE